MNKKEEERCFLDVLIELDPDFPTGKIFPSESPDFIIRSGTKNRIGIEITKFTRSEFNYREEQAEHFIPHLTKEHLNELVHSKEEKLGLYRRRRLKSIWLLIIANGFSNSDAFNVHNQIANWHIESKFDRILLVELQHRKLYVVYEKQPD